MHTHSSDIKKVIVIGSGIAGIATAIRLAVQGMEVSVYEKNNYPGGKLSAFEKDGYLFDAGPSLFTQPYLIEELFTLANEPIADYFQYRRIPVACNYFYENGKTIKAYADLDLFAAELNKQFGESPDALRKYLQSAKKAYQSIGTVFLSHSLHKKSTWLHRRIFKAMAAVKFGYLFKTLHQYNTKSFSSPEAIQLFNRYATYNGSNPFQAPAMLSMIPHLEFNEGVFYPTGGMVNITEALVKLAEKKGVRFYYNQAVEKIIHNEGTVSGVVINQQNIYADIVVSNMDIYFTYKNLLQSEYKAKDVLRQERSSSALVFYWGIKKSFPQLDLHNIFFSADYKTEFDALFKKGTLVNDPTVYINITSKMEGSMAPAGCENWFVMINAPANTGQDWTQLQASARTHIIEKLNRLLNTDMAPLIETEEILDPVLMEKNTFSYRGSLYGTSSNSKMAAFLRHPNFSSTIQGLYCCGGTVHPGGGIPLCLQSAKIVSEFIDSKNKA